MRGQRIAPQGLGLLTRISLLRLTFGGNLDDVKQYGDVNKLIFECLNVIATTSPTLSPNKKHPVC
jgi:hypothetical protein